MEYRRNPLKTNVFAHEQKKLNHVQPRKSYGFQETFKILGKTAFPAIRHSQAKAVPGMAPFSIPFVHMSQLLKPLGKATFPGRPQPLQPAGDLAEIKK